MKKLSVLLALLLVLSLSVPAVASAASAEPVRVFTLNGTTGFGLAGLIAENKDGGASQEYSFSVETDASNVTAALVNGDCDIAALPTNAAAALYNKTEGKVQVIALNTLGVLYVVTDGSVEVSSIKDLEGQTVYAPAQNPSFLFQALCDANGVKVTVDNSFAQPAEL
ncbi:MAG: ABC transporter substrate-binding protein, partial [Eubacteriales bacterium]